MRYIFLILSFLTLFSCGYYSFSGASIPPHIKSCQVIRFENYSSRYDLLLSDRFTDLFIEKIEDYDLLTIEDSRTSDAKISGRIKSFSDDVRSKIDDDTVDQRTIKMVIEIQFFDNKNRTPIVDKSSITKSEDYSESDGVDGFNEALDKLLESITEEAALKLISNW